MKRPSFQFYPADWKSNSNLSRCTHEEKGIWIDVMCLLHDQNEYGVSRWTLKEIAQSVRCSVAKLRGLIAKGILKGADIGIECETLQYVPKSGRKTGPEVILIDSQRGPIWYSSRMVIDEYKRILRAEYGEALKGTPNPSPKGGIGEAPKDTPDPSPKGGIGPLRAGTPADVSSSSSLKDKKEKREKEKKENGSEQSSSLPLETIQPDAIDPVKPNLDRPDESIKLERDSPPKPAKRSLDEPDSRGSRIPKEWTLPKEWADWALQKRPELSPEVVQELSEQFHCHWKAKVGTDARKADWYATWQNWVHKDRDYFSKIRGKGQGPPVWTSPDFSKIKYEPMGFL